MQSVNVLGSVNTNAGPRRAICIPLLGDIQDGAEHVQIVEHLLPGGVGKHASIWRYCASVISMYIAHKMAVSVNTP